MTKLTLEQAMNLAKLAQNNGNLQLAARYYNAILVHDAAHNIAKRELEKINLELGQLDLSTGSIHSVIKTLLFLYTNGDFIGVIKTAERFSSKFSENERLFLIKGAAEAKTGAVADAIKSFSECLRINPVSVDARFNLGKLQHNEGQYESALENYQTVLEIDNGHSGALNNAAIILKDSGNFREAFDLFVKSLEINGEDAEIQKNAIELLKLYNPPELKKSSLVELDKFIKEAGLELSSSEPVRSINTQLNIALRKLSSHKPILRTNLSQVFYRNSVDLNCERHFDVFDRCKIIPSFCFSCIKIQIDVQTLTELIDLTLMFSKAEILSQYTRKCMIEMRANVTGFYKGLVYCRSLEEAKKLTNFISGWRDNLQIKIKRGCSEFEIAYEGYEVIEDASKQIMQYPSSWTKIETEYDSLGVPLNEKPVFASLPSLCLSDLLVIEKWLDYAHGIGDPSLSEYEYTGTKYGDVYRVSAKRKDAYSRLTKV